MSQALTAVLMLLSLYDRAPTPAELSAAAPDDPAGVLLVVADDPDVPAWKRRWCHPWWKRRLGLSGLVTARTWLVRPSLLCMWHCSCRRKLPVRRDRCSATPSGLKTHLASCLLAP